MEHHKSWLLPGPRPELLLPLLSQRVLSLTSLILPPQQIGEPPGAVVGTTDMGITSQGGSFFTYRKFNHFPTPQMKHRQK